VRFSLEYAEQPQSGGAASHGKAITLSLVGATVALQPEPRWQQRRRSRPRCVSI